MIALLQTLLLGATVFVEQDLPGVEVGAVSFPATHAPVNTAVADVNGDDQPDLILPRIVRLQIAGKFPESATIRHPENAEFEQIEVEDDLFYGYSGGRIVAYRFQPESGSWSHFWESNIDVVDSEATHGFFCDVDADGHTELVLAGPDRLRLFRLGRSAVPAGELDVYPPRRAETEAKQNLWTLRSPPPAPNSTYRRFRISFHGQELMIRETIWITDAISEYVFAGYRVTTMDNNEFEAQPDRVIAYRGLPDFMFPCRLGPSEEIDFAGIHPAPGTTERWAPPLYDIVVQMAGHGERRVVRTKSWPANVSATDFDADGDLDILAETNDLFEAPPREMALAIASQRTLRHTISVHVHEVGGTFARTPRRLLTTTIRFPTPLMRGDVRWERYRNGELTSTTGDFNGDGRSDIAVWERPPEISIYLNHEGVYESTPDLTVGVPLDVERLAVADIDMDGKSDLALLPAADSKAGPRVYLSR
jgi:hypothetical protein